MQKCCDMTVLKLDDSIDRFRFATSCLGLVGCLCISYSVWTPFWLADRGLWTDLNSTRDHQAGAHPDDIPHNALEAEQVFGALSFLMAVSSGVLCFVFALCWTSETVRSYSNTRSLLMAGQALYPTTLLLLILVPTGFFFLLSWSVFTYQHKEQIQQDLTCLGSSYWFGALGWVLLLVAVPAVFMAEQCVVPDILPDLEKAVGLWRAASLAKSRERPFSEGCYPGYNREGHSMDLRRYLLSP